MKKGITTVSKGVLMKNVEQGVLIERQYVRRFDNFKYLQDVNGININDVNSSPIRVKKR